MENGQEVSSFNACFKHVSPYNFDFWLMSIGFLLPNLFCPTVRKKYSSDREKLLRSLEQFIQTERMPFITCSWRFLISNKLRTIRIGKNYWDLNFAGKVFVHSKKNESIQNHFELV